jgi:hypothetical protein
MWKSGIQLFLRRFDNTLEQLDYIRKFFEQAVTEISSIYIYYKLGYKKTDNLLKQICFKWVDFEIYKSPIKDKTFINKIMDMCVDKFNDIEVWERYINIEKHFGDYNSIRNIFQRAIECACQNKDVLKSKFNEWKKK